MRLTCSAALLLLALALSSCTPRDQDTAKKNLDEAGKELRKDLKETGRDVKKGLDEAGKELHHGAEKAKVELKKGAEALKEKDEKLTHRQP